MAAEVYAFFNTFHKDYFIYEVLGETMQRTIDLKAYVDTRTLFNIFCKDGNTEKSRLQIVVLAFKESYRRGKTKKLRGPSRIQNAAKVLIKEVFS